MHDLIIVGGGPAGLATAICAAHSGLSVALLEKRRFPLDKACGEGIMPHGVRLLSKMGIPLPKSHPFEGIRYVDGDRIATARFREGRGYGIRRVDLSRALAEKARELGADLLESTAAEAVSVTGEGVRVRTVGAEIRARWLVAADGLGSALRRSGGLEIAGRRGFRRYGYRRHYRIRPWSRFVEVHWGAGAEAYVTPVADDEVGVAFLWHEKAPSYERMLARFPSLARRLEGALPTSPLAGAGPFRRRARRVVEGRLALVGDASGYVDALTGEGVALALECAEALVGALSRENLASYASAHRKLTRRYRVMTELVLTLARHPGLRRPVLAALSRSPALFERLVALSHQRGGASDPVPSGPRRARAATVIE